MSRYTITIAATILAIAACATGAQARRGPMMADPMGDATVSRAQAKDKAIADFAVFDTDHDGFLSAAELMAMRPIRGGPGAPPPGRDGGGGMPPMMMRADTDGDGKLSQDEFVAMALMRFDRADTDHDGQLTKAERDAARARMRARMQARDAGPPTDRDIGGPGPPNDGPNGDGGPGGPGGD